MSTYINRQRKQSTSADEPETDRTELSEVRQRLFNVYEYVRDEDAELYTEIDQWLRESVDVPAGSVGEAVKSRLREIKRGNKMRDHRGVDDPTDAFHDDCEGCPNYGVACPMVKGYRGTQTIKRILETARTDEQVVEQLSDLAIEEDCHIVLDELNEYEDSHANFLKTGYELNARANRVVSGPVSPTGADAEGVEAEFSESDSLPPDAEETVESTIEAVLSDEEDEDE
ncbi:hypothetical protein [Natronorubrum daqingense]|uniref:Uncharacterized protein n=1 Tax=Natronorubrum daqingense TaxID=588898 RepID=A0A1N7FXE9_9EURY|nr:hypothetical protein [Natronorubrum daqingense]APX98538.1 hypothetical protein BB347_17680 [Natronorubrum daqingense]SIS05043.1 hypothetical protein SAMN05421809_3543 [Natronorubrum daqingense]